MSIIAGPDATSHGWAESAPLRDALDAARVHGAVTPVSRSNMRALVSIAELLRRERVTRWELRCMEHRDDPSCPRLAMAVPRVLHAAAHAERAGLEVALAGFPTCLLGPYARLMVATATRDFPSRCEGCGLREGCPGIDAAYVRRYGADELSPRTGSISSQPKRRK